MPVPQILRISGRYLTIHDNRDKQKSYLSVHEKVNIIIEALVPLMSRNSLAAAWKELEEQFFSGFPSGGGDPLLQ
jgi:hypothetical protein